MRFKSNKCCYSIYIVGSTKTFESAAIRSVARLSNKQNSPRSNRAYPRERNGNKGLFIMSPGEWNVRGPKAESVTTEPVEEWSLYKSESRWTSEQDGDVRSTKTTLSSRPQNGHRYLSSGCTIYPKRLVDIRATRETLSFLSVLDLGWSLSKAYKEEGPLEHLIKCAWVGWEIRHESGPGPVIYSSACDIMRRTRFGGKLALLSPSVTLASVQSFRISAFYNF